MKPDTGDAVEGEEGADTGSGVDGDVKVELLSSGAAARQAASVQATPSWYQEPWHLFGSRGSSKKLLRRTPQRSVGPKKEWLVPRKGTKLSDAQGHGAEQTSPAPRRPALPRPSPLRPWEYRSLTSNGPGPEQAGQGADSASAGVHDSENDALTREGLPMDAPTLFSIAGGTSGAIGAKSPMSQSHDAKFDHGGGAGQPPPSASHQHQRPQPNHDVAELDEDGASFESDSTFGWDEAEKERYNLAIARFHDQGSVPPSEEPTQAATTAPAAKLTNMAKAVGFARDSGPHDCGSTERALPGVPINAIALMDARDKCLADAIAEFGEDPDYGHGQATVGMDQAPTTPTREFNSSGTTPLGGGSRHITWAPHRRSTFVRAPEILHHIWDEERGLDDSGVEPMSSMGVDALDVYEVLPRSRVAGVGAACEAPSGMTTSTKAALGSTARVLFPTATSRKAGLFVPFGDLPSVDGASRAPAGNATRSPSGEAVRKSTGQGGDILNSRPLRNPRGQIKYLVHVLKEPAWAGKSLNGSSVFNGRLAPLRRKSTKLLNRILEMLNAYYGRSLKDKAPLVRLRKLGGKVDKSWDLLERGVAHIRVEDFDEDDAEHATRQRLVKLLLDLREGIIPNFVRLLDHLSKLPVASETVANDKAARFPLALRLLKRCAEVMHDNADQLSALDPGLETTEELGEELLAKRSMLERYRGRLAHELAKPVTQGSRAILESLRRDTPALERLVQSIEERLVVAELASSDEFLENYTRFERLISRIMNPLNSEDTGDSKHDNAKEGFKRWSEYCSRFLGLPADSDPAPRRNNARLDEYSGLRAIQSSSDHLEYAGLDSEETDNLLQASSQGRPPSNRPSGSGSALLVPWGARRQLEVSLPQTPLNPSRKRRWQDDSSSQTTSGEYDVNHSIRMHGFANLATRKMAALVRRAQAGTLHRPRAGTPKNKRRKPDGTSRAASLGSPTHSPIHSLPSPSTNGDGSGKHPGPHNDDGVHPGGHPESEDHPDGGESEADSHAQDSDVEASHRAHHWHEPSRQDFLKRNRPSPFSPRLLVSRPNVDGDESDVDMEPPRRTSVDACDVVYIESGDSSDSD